MYHVKHTIIGGGVVGIAVAKHLSRFGSTLLIERNRRLGDETSSRNSQVIHAGLYYPAESLKAALCIEGRTRLYRYCKQHSIPFAQTGKWIVAQNSAEADYLHKLADKATSLGVPTQFLSRRETQAEPLLRCSLGLLSPETSILCCHTYMQQLAADFERQDGIVSLRTTVIDIVRNAVGVYTVTTCPTDQTATIGQDSCTNIESEIVVNCAGLYADHVASLMFRPKLLPPRYRQYWCRGTYLRLKGTQRPFKRLIYPCPEENLKGLGIHLTLDLNGNVRFGPDTEYIDAFHEQRRGASGLSQDPALGSAAAAFPYVSSATLYGLESDSAAEMLRAEKFFNAIRRYFPALQSPLDLEVDYCGIRPKLSGPGGPLRDFLIAEESSHGFPGFVNAIGIESPGLTSSLAIANHIGKLLGYAESPFD